MVREMQRKVSMLAGTSLRKADMSTEDASVIWTPMTEAPAPMICVELLRRRGESG